MGELVNYGPCECCGVADDTGQNACINPGNFSLDDPWTPSTPIIIGSVSAYSSAYLTCVWRNFPYLPDGACIGTVEHTYSPWMLISRVPVGGFWPHFGLSTEGCTLDAQLDAYEGQALLIRYDTSGGGYCGACGGGDILAIYGMDSADFDPSISNVFSLLETTDPGTAAATITVDPV